MAVAMFSEICTQPALLAYDHLVGLHYYMASHVQMTQYVSQPWLMTKSGEWVNMLSNQGGLQDCDFFQYTGEVVLQC